jgi:PKD repeat protein
LWPERGEWQVCEDAAVHRRAFLGRAAAFLGASLVGKTLLHADLANAAVIPGTGPYGPLQAADANGVQLPAGFTSRVIAVTGQPVAATGYTWHTAPDGGACFAAPGGGWIYASNSEVGLATGGVSAVRFNADGSTAAAYRILTGTNRNCSGGPTPWGTWLSCEENGSTGKVYECDPQQPSQGVQRPLLGSFAHEAAAVDPATGNVYLTEDDPAGRLYRFVPTNPGDLTAGTLHAANLSGTSVTWLPVSTSAPDRSAGTTPFNGGEGAWISGGTLWFTTKGDRKVWELDLATQQLTELFAYVAGSGAALNAVDNITVHEPSGDLFVAEDGGNMELCIIGAVAGQDTVAPFLRFIGQDASEVAGPAFSPDGTRLYVSSQRGTNGTTGITYEITGPFRTGPVTPPPTVVVAQDAFGRTVSGSWGSADVGGVWARSGTASNFSVSGGAGRILLPTASLIRSSTLSSVVVADVDLSADLSLDKAPTGGGTIVSLVARKIGSSEYRLRAYLRPTSKSLQVMRVLNGAETTIATVNLPGGGVTAGQVLHLRLLATGTGSTALTGKVWFDGDAEPAGWQVQAVDSTAALQQPGAVGVHVYVSSSTTNAPMTLTTDNLLATAPGTEPPPNQDPTAAFTASPADLTVSVDGSASDDPDGSIATYAWSFGDGASASGPSPTASHTYAAAGTYTVLLTVTDDQGATDQTSQSVTVVDPGAPDAVAQDAFGRTVSSSWGSADVGGVWTRNGPAGDFSVSGGVGRIVLPTSGLIRAATLGSVAVAAVDLSADLSLDKAPTGGGTIVSLVARKIGSSEYRLRAYLRPTSKSLQVMRVLNGAETTIATVNLPGGGVTPGQVLHLRLLATGSGSTALSGKAWFDGAAEPSAWQVQAVDSTAALQQPGGVGVHVYVSSSGNKSPMTVTTDNLLAVQP